jgi:hypothetical protein
VQHAMRTIRIVTVARTRVDAKQDLRVLIAPLTYAKPHVVENMVLVLRVTSGLHRYFRSQVSKLVSVMRDGQGISVHSILVLSRERRALEMANA